MSIPARVRLTLARSPWLYWAIVGVFAGTAGLLVMRAADGVEAERRSWGESRQVLVAVRDLAPGTALESAVALRHWPTPMVPADAVTAVDEVAVARQQVAAGEVIVAHDVAPGAAPQALIPDGWLAVAIAESVASNAGVGTAVAIATGGLVLADDGLVVGRVGEALLVAVPADVAAEVAGASATGDVAVLIRR